MDLQTRRIEIAGIAPRPDGEWMQQIARNLHIERNHQGLGNKLIEDQRVAGNENRNVECHRRLGGILNYYYHRAA